MKGCKNPQRMMSFYGRDKTILATVVAGVILGLLFQLKGYASQLHPNSSDSPQLDLLCNNGYDGQLYFNRSEFLSAIENEVVIDFEDEPTGPVGGDPWISYGIVFDEAGVGDNMAIGNGGGANKNIYALGGESADIYITFPGTLTAFGLDVFSNQEHRSSERIIFYDIYDSVLANVEMPQTALQGTAFVGYIADEPMISKVTFIEGNNEGDYAGIGDVALMIPEPASATMFALGAALLVNSRRRD